MVRKNLGSLMNGFTRNLQPGCMQLKQHHAVSLRRDNNHHVGLSHRLFTIYEYEFDLDLLRSLWILLIGGPAMCFNSSLIFIINLLGEAYTSLTGWTGSPIMAYFRPQL